MRQPREQQLAGNHVRRKASHGLPARWWLLVGLLALVGHIPPEALFVLALGATLCSLLDSRCKVVLMPTRYWLPLAACAGIGLFGAAEWTMRDIVRDLWLIGAPLCLTGYGWTLVRSEADLKHLLETVVIGATLWSAAHVAGALQYIETLSIGRDAFRQTAGSGSMLPVLAIYVVVAGRLSRSGSPTGRRWRDFPCLALCGLSMAVSLSRTWWIVLFTMLCVAGWLRLGGLRTAFAGALLCLGSLVALELGGWKGNYPPYVLAAFQHGFLESTYATNLVAQKDLNLFWRSYEAYRAIETLRALPVDALIFGRGLGAQLDLGLYQLLDGQYRRFIPILHNGYLYVTLKAGLVGLGLYLVWLWIWVSEGVRFARRNGPWVRLVGGLVLGMALSLVETSQVIGGAFNVGATFALFVILGAAARWMHVTRQADLEVSS